MTSAEKGGKARQPASFEAARRPNLRVEAYNDAKSGGKLFVIGNLALLQEPLLGLMCSRECPGHVFLETLALVPEWVKAGRVIVSGFHSPLEQQVLRSVLRRSGRVVKVLARGMADYRPAPEEREPLTSSRMLVVSAFAPIVTRTTRETALARNRLVLALATEIVAPFVANASPLMTILSEKGRNERYAK